MHVYRADHKAAHTSYPTDHTTAPTLYPTGLNPASTPCPTLGALLFSALILASPIPTPTTTVALLAALAPWPLPSATRPCALPL